MFQIYRSLQNSPDWKKVPCATFRTIKDASAYALALSECNRNTQYVVVSLLWADEILSNDVIQGYWLVTTKAGVIEESFGF